jgi:hypothetical protein
MALWTQLHGYERASLSLSAREFDHHFLGENYLFSPFFILHLQSALYKAVHLQSVSVVSCIAPRRLKVSEDLILFAVSVA